MPVIRVLNYQFDPPDPRDRPLTFKTPNRSELLPAKTDLSDKLGMVYEQGNLGACTACSLCSQLTFLSKQNGAEQYFSRLYCYWFGRQLAGYPLNQDSGLSLRQAIKAVANGIVLETDWPYIIPKFSQKPSVEVVRSSQKCIAYVAVDHDLQSLRRCLVKKPISFGLTLRKSFMSKAVAASGLIPIPEVNEPAEGGHCMLLVGYNSDMKLFKVLNSWGPQWGQRGYCFIPQDMILNPTMTADFWCVTELRFDANLVRPLAPARRAIDTAATIIASVEATEWVPDRMYSNQQRVIFEDSVYVCRLGHRSIPIWTPSATAVLWKLL
ncbi:hypothetical protein DFS34DRAFT_489815 [Phlyctochytrium arcticum]|nr:hypothetical protein DFS34DRAFT_489815 [Phlyctochytrium arcticum]